MSDVKISLEELKQALACVEGDSFQDYVTVSADNMTMTIKVYDRKDDLITIQLFSTDTQLMAKKTVTSKL